jgi:hypothetical protein
MKRLSKYANHLLYQVNIISIAATTVYIIHGLSNQLKSCTDQRWLREKLSNTNAKLIVVENKTSSLNGT